MHLKASKLILKLLLILLSLAITAGLGYVFFFHVSESVKIAGIVTWICFCGGVFVLLKSLIETINKKL